MKREAGVLSSIFFASSAIIDMVSVICISTTFAP